MELDMVETQIKTLTAFLDTVKNKGQQTEIENSIATWETQKVKLLKQLNKG